MQKSRLGRFFGNAYVRGVLLIVVGLVIGSLYKSLTDKLDIIPAFRAFLSIVLFTPIPLWCLLAGLVALLVLVRFLYRLGNEQKPAYVTNYVKDEIHRGMYRWKWERQNISGRWYPLDFELICPDCECRLSGKNARFVSDPGPGQWCPDCMRTFDEVQQRTVVELQAIVSGRVLTRHMK
jgi:hypothetical protein